MPQTCRGTGITIYTSSKSGCGTGSRSSNCPDLGKQHVQCNLQQAVVANLPSGDLGAAERQAAESLTCTAPLQARKAHLEEFCLSSWLPQYSLSTQRILFTKRSAARCKRQAQKKKTSELYGAEQHGASLAHDQTREILREVPDELHSHLQLIRCRLTPCRWRRPVIH